MPHEPVQPSLPHTRPVHDGVHPHVPPALHVSPVAQVPQLPPQPSGPHALPTQLGTHAH